MPTASGGQAVVISRDEMHGLFSGVLNDTDRDAVTFAARIDGAIARLTGLDTTAVRVAALVLYATLFIYLLLWIWRGNDWLRAAA